MIKKEKVMKKTIIYAALLLIARMVIGSEKDALIVRERVSVEGVSTYNPFSPNIRIGNKEINNSVLLTLQPNHRKKIEDIAKPSFIVACCGGINNQRIKESDIITITKIANKQKDHELRKAIDGMVVETIDVKNSCCMNDKTKDIPTMTNKLMCSNLAGCCGGSPFVLGGIFCHNHCCCIAAGPVGILISLATFLGMESVLCMNYHYCSERKIYRFSFDKNEVNEQDKDAEN